MQAAADVPGEDVPGEAASEDGMSEDGVRGGAATGARTVVVLGGGGSLGAFQAGGLLALADHGVLPDVLVGCSAGALNAAFLAAGPSAERVATLAGFWLDPTTHRVLAPSTWSRLRGLAGAAATRSPSLLDAGPLRRLVAAQVGAHDVSELAVPVSVTTTCLDCGRPVHHSRGPLRDVLLASCALPGLLPPVRLPDGHTHVDGGVLCGVPVEHALTLAAPGDRVLVLDCGLAPVTGVAGRCAALPAAAGACGLDPVGRADYQAPVDSGRLGVLDVVLRAFAVARAAANTAAVGAALADPRVRVLPHVADAWAAGMLERLPAGPRDFAATALLLAAGRAATEAWLATGGLAQRRQTACAA